MRRARSIALAAAVAGAMLGCTGPERTEGLSCVFRVGPWGDGMPDLEMQVGDTVRVPLKDHFGPVDCLVGLEYHYEEYGSDFNYFEAESSDPAAVAVSTSRLDLEAVASGVADSVRVTVWHNLNMSTVRSHEFHVSVGDSTGR